MPMDKIPNGKIKLFSFSWLKQHFWGRREDAGACLSCIWAKAAHAPESVAQLIARIWALGGGILLYYPWVPCSRILQQCSEGVLASRPPIKHLPPVLEPRTLFCSVKCLQIILNVNRLNKYGKDWFDSQPSPLQTELLPNSWTDKGTKDKTWGIAQNTIILSGVIVVITD